MMDEQAKLTIDELQRKLEMRAMGPSFTYDALCKVLAMMKDNKPNDRSEKDRYWAISITDMEKVVAFFRVYIYG